MCSLNEQAKVYYAHTNKKFSFAEAPLRVTVCGLLKNSKNSRQSSALWLNFYKECTRPRRRSCAQLAKFCGTLRKTGRLHKKHHENIISAPQPYTKGRQQEKTFPHKRNTSTLHAVHTDKIAHLTENYNN